MGHLRKMGIKKKAIQDGFSFSGAGGAFLPLRLGLHHTACNVQMVELFTLDDHFLIGRVEGLQHHAVAALDVALQGALALVAVLSQMVSNDHLASRPL